MSVLRRYRLVAFAVIVATVAGAQDVPSGQPITLHEVLLDNVNGEDWLRFRFIAPRIGRADSDISYADSAPDMAHLCGNVVIPYMAEYNLTGHLIVVSLADQETEFGATNPDATQFFDAFRVENGACIWEVF